MIASLILATLTYANPLDVNYVVSMGKKFSDHRSPADPEVIFHAGKYWLFASCSGGYFMSEDLVAWTWIHTDDLPFCEWAPTVEEVDGRLVFTARGRSVHRAVDPARGVWERLSAKVPHGVDSALFADAGRLYLYWGGDDTDRPLFGCEIDPKTFGEISPPVSTYAADNARYGYEVRGDNNEMTGRHGYFEGSHMFRRGDTYYFQCAGPGTQYASYADVAFRGATPLGPFSRQRTNPFSCKPTGYIPSAGHGKTFADRYGNVWHVATGLVEGFSRRLVMFPVFFDADGEMWCDSAFADWPVAVPDRKVAAPEELRTGWMELAEGKRVTASTETSGHPAALAIDDRVATFWQAASGRAGESLMVDFGGAATVRSVQLGFGDSATERHVYRIEVETPDGVRLPVVDAKGERSFAEHPYHQLREPVVATRLRVVNARDLAAGERFALRGVRVFGSMDKPKPATPAAVKVARDASDRRRAVLTWEPVAGATGYLIRFGVTPAKLHLARTSKDCRVEIRSLDTEEPYAWSVTAYNEAGFSEPSRP